MMSLHLQPLCENDRNVEETNMEKTLVSNGFGLSARKSHAVNTLVTVRSKFDSPDFKLGILEF